MLALSLTQAAECVVLGMKIGQHLSTRPLVSVVAGAEDAGRPVKSPPLTGTSFFFLFFFLYFCVSAS